MTHSFPFDPAVILGVSSGASLSEIRDAYRQKSMKYHPDKGGDEWAFRLVARSYEILSTARVADRAAEEHARPRPNPGPPPRPRPSDFGSAQAQAQAHTHNHAQNHASPGQADDNLKTWGGALRSHEEDALETASQIVNAELLILRYELDGAFDMFGARPEARNLSCSLHIAWPVMGLADRAETLPQGELTLQKLNKVFQLKPVLKHALKEQSSTEHGRFEGWLTFNTAVHASEALEALREALAREGLVLEKKIREMAIPRPR